MFEDCSGARTSAAKSLRDVRRTISRTIDFHSHIKVERAAELVQPYAMEGTGAHAHETSPETAEVNRLQNLAIRDKLTSIETKLAEMDRMGIDLQVLSPAPVQYYYWADPELGRESSRLINDEIADVVASQSERFGGLGTIPMQCPDFAVAELKRIVKDLGLSGVELGTNIAGEELSDPKFDIVFQTAAELNVMIFMHPMGFSNSERLSKYHLNNVIGNPLDTTVAITHLIFSGMFDRYPDLKICAAHGGGFLSALAGRMDHAHKYRSDCQGCKNAPSSYLKNFYYDTLVFDQDHLLFLLNKIGAERVLLGSDFPFDMGDPDPVGNLLALADLSNDELSMILGGNAEKILSHKASDV